VLIVALPTGSARSLSDERRSIYFAFMIFTSGVLSNVGRTCQSHPDLVLVVRALVLDRLEPRIERIGHGPLLVHGGGELASLDPALRDTVLLCGKLGFAPRTIRRRPWCASRGSGRARRPGTISFRRPPRAL
jgi:hypothetical protein